MGVVNTNYTFTATDVITSTKMNNIIDDTTFTNDAVFTGGTVELSTGKLRVRAGSITSNELSTDSVVTTKILNNNVTTAKLETSTSTTTGVTSAKIANDAVITAKIANSNVTTPKIADANITAPKLSGAQTGSAPVYGVRAWVNFNGTATTNATGTYSRTSGSTTAVVSITDHGLITGHHVQLDFASGTADGIYIVTKVDNNTFTITTTETTAQSSVVVSFGKITIISNGNVSNVIRVGTGRYMINFLTALPSANYAFTSSVGDDADTDLTNLLVGIPFNAIKTNQSIYVTSATGGGTATNSPSVNLMFIE